VRIKKIGQDKISQDSRNRHDFYMLIVVMLNITAHSLICNRVCSIKLSFRSFLQASSVQTLSQEVIFG